MNIKNSQLDYGKFKSIMGGYSSHFVNTFCELTEQYNQGIFFLYVKNV